MTSSEAIVGRTRWPYGLWGSLLLIVTLECGVITAHDLYFTERTTHCWQYAGRMARSPQVIRSDLLCLGDSQIKLGLIPTVIESLTSYSAFNLAVPGGQAPSSYFLLRRALDAGARPRGIVIGVFPGLLAVDQRMNLSAWPELLDLREAIDLGWWTRDLDLFVRINLARVLSSFHKRSALRDRILRALQGAPNEEHENVLAHIRNWQVHRGGQLTPARDDFHDEVDPSLAASIHQRRWRPNPVNDAYLDRFIRLARRYGIQVFWLMPTISPAWQAHREQEGLDTGYEEFARRKLVRHPNLVILDGRRSLYDVTAFRDAFHLERRGAVALSEDLGKMVDAVLKSSETFEAFGGDLFSSRWLYLPPYRDRPDHRLLEDVEDSIRFVAEAQVERISQ